LPDEERHAFVDDRNRRADHGRLMQEGLASIGEIDAGVLARDDDVVLVALVHLRHAVPRERARVRPPFGELLRIRSRGNAEDARQRADDLNETTGGAG